jgi:hypothetical protein
LINPGGGKDLGDIKVLKELVEELGKEAPVPAML